MKPCAHSRSLSPASPRPTRAGTPRNQPLGVDQKNSRGYRVREERLDPAGKLIRRILERPPGGSPYNAQGKINAFNFPFTGNPGSGCFFRCAYCYLRQPFFQRHVTADHGIEMNYVPAMAESTRRFLGAKAGLPQYMKRVQMGVSTEMFMPQMLEYTRPGEVLKAFRDGGRDWMVHLVTKSPAILDFADQLAEMRDQVQVEVSFVTLDETASRHFEQGTPSVAQRLRVIEELAQRGIFVRMMLMPIMREYELQSVGANREIVYRHVVTGERRPGRKRVVQVDGNCSAQEVPLELHDSRHWGPAEEPESWRPIVRHDWSNSAHAQTHWSSYGASAYKQKDLNYYYIDELLKARAEERAPKAERGRTEDPTAEALIHSGESVRHADGRERLVEVKAWHLPRSKWADSETSGPPVIERRVMDFGYRFHSKINWIDCI